MSAHWRQYRNIRQHTMTGSSNQLTTLYWRYTSNILSLNLSKTEFLIIGIPRQLAKLRNPTIHPPNNVILTLVDCARNLGVIFVSQYLNLALLSLNYVFTIFVITVDFVILSINQLLVLLLLPLSILKLTNTTLFYLISLQLKLTVCNSSSILMLVLLSTLLNFTISLTSSNLLVTSPFRFTSHLFLMEQMSTAGRKLHRHLLYTAHTYSSMRKCILFEIGQDLLNS